MFGYSTLGETWDTQWGPEPVLALHGADERSRPITLPGRGTAKRRAGVAAARTPDGTGARGFV